MSPHLVDPPVYSIVGALLHYGVAPWQVAAATFVLLPLVLVVVCWWSGTLRIAASAMNPNGHGLFSPINAYLPVTVPLNYAIVDYYLTYQHEVTGLYQRGVLAPASLEWLSSPLEHAFAIVAYAAALGFAIQNTWFRERERSGITNWLCMNGVRRHVLYYFSIAFFFCELSIIFGWFLHHILVWFVVGGTLQAAALDPFSPGRMFGLEALSQMTWSGLIVISLAILGVALWLGGARLTLKQEAFESHPGHYKALVGTSICGLLVVCVPLLAPHGVMTEKKRDVLYDLGAEVSKASIALRSEVQRQVPEAEISRLRTALTVQREFYDEVDNSTTWPVSRKVVAAFPLGLFSPLLAAGGRRLWRRMRSMFNRQVAVSSPTPAVATTKVASEPSAVHDNALRGGEG